MARERFSFDVACSYTAADASIDKLKERKNNSHTQKKSTQSYCIGKKFIRLVDFFNEKQKK